MLTAAALHVSIPWSKIQNCLILPRLIPFQEKLQNAKFLFWAQSAAMMGASAAAWRCWYCWCDVDTGQQRPAAWSTYKLVSASGFRNNFVWNLNIVSVKCPGCRAATAEQLTADCGRGSGFQILDFHFSRIGSVHSNEWERECSSSRL